MRPYTEDQIGKTPAGSKKRHSRRGQKAMNGVKKTLVKAKVSAVKTKRKLQAKDAEEVEDLLEMTANGQPGTPVGKAITAKSKTALKTTANGTTGSKASSAAKQMKKLKSLVEVSAKTENGKSPSQRKSERLRNKQPSFSASNGHQNGEGPVEMGVEAMEINGHNEGKAGSTNGGLFQRTISKIWRIPEGITGVPYADIDSPDATPKAATSTDKTETSNGDASTSSESQRKSCVIS